MRFRAIVVCLLSAAALAQAASPAAPQREPKSVTVPITLDHNRIIVDVDLPLPDGSTRRAKAWVDNGNPHLYLSRRVATLMGLNVTCGEQECSAPPPKNIVLGGMTISLAAVKEAKIPLKPVASAAVIFPGLAAEITVPSAVLRNYDVLINFPGRELTIAQPGSLKFTGTKTKVVMNVENGLIQVPSRIEGKKYNLALDLGSSISALSDELFAQLAASHGGWPHMTGAIGPANLWGYSEEPGWKLMRSDRVQYGPLYLTNVPFLNLSAVGKVEYFASAAKLTDKRSEISSSGLLGSEALVNYRVGLDYAHSAVYFEIGRTFNFPDFDVVGLILRPEDDGRFTVIGIADYESEPSVPKGTSGVQPGDHLVAVDSVPMSGATMGQVWSSLGGTPGKERRLTIERNGTQFAVNATVKHFLGEPEVSQSDGRISRKK